MIDEESWELPSKPLYIFCPDCVDKAWISENHNDHLRSPEANSINIGGIFIVEDFVTKQEQDELIPMIDTRQPWIPSQEGRAKQDYGPKVSFLKQKVSVGNFGGFPDFAVNLFNRMETMYPKEMQNFTPVEFCILEYTPQRGSYIRPHFDDKWIWGDRLITINLLSDTVLRLTREFRIPPYEIVIKMPARSLLILYGEARYDWHHSIKKYDIKSRRIAMTWREFSDEIMNDPEYTEFIKEVFTIATQRVTTG